MKRIQIFMLLLGVSLFSFSQNKQLLYGFSEIPQALMLNPGGEVTNDWYVGVPLLSHIHFNYGATASTAYDIFEDNNVDFNVKLRNAISGMESTDFYSINQQLEIFSGGFAFGNRFEKNEYISFGLYQELDFILYFPKDFAVLALEGNQNNINRLFKASDLNVAADMVSVFHLGYNKKVNDKFTFGARGKIYSSIANVRSTKNKGGFYTEPGQNNIYNHVFDLDMEVNTSGIASLLDDENSDASNDISTLQKRVLFGGNLGLGLDLGFTYKLNDQWDFDASVLDVGFISHTKDVENHVLNGRYEYEGLNPLFPQAREGESADDYWSNIEEDLEDVFQVDSTTTKYTTWRPVKFNASLNYAFGEKQSESCYCTDDETGYLNAVGLQLFSMSRPKQPQVALTAYYYRRLFNGLRFKATYTVDSYSFNNLGLGMSAHIWGAHFYVMADNLLQYKNVYDAQSVSLQLGFNYIFNKK
ncbi:DUF5723 family protein [Algibacter miyuki]|uniref:DUF5723 family protein n=1 Tax=Algibacter miyuki TaxID=1306933 RepID=A0ABV5H0Z3_9FLAO|nr:DUF5723 family protein [Algibacter miyuki]MDN3666187.1 DUF5723 family protein [Algibacter miyuki]